MPTQHVSRVRSYLDDGATIQTSGGDLAPGGGGGGALRVLTVSRTAVSAKTSNLTFQVKDESGANVAGNAFIRVDLFENDTAAGGFVSRIYLKNATSGTLLATSAGFSTFSAALGTTDATGLLAFPLGPSSGAPPMTTYRYRIFASVQQTSTTAVAWGVTPVTLGWTVQT